MRQSGGGGGLTSEIFKLLGCIMCNKGQRVEAHRSIKTVSDFNTSLSVILLHECRAKSFSLKLFLH